MNIGIDITQIVNSTVANIESQLEGRARDASYALKEAITNVIRGQGSGRVYRLPAGGTYRASAPGEPPVARSSGGLRESWRPMVVNGRNPAIESNVIYAGYLEEGTSRMAPRPYEEKTVQAAMPEIEAIYGAPFV